jgi:hypothetical protein
MPLPAQTRPFGQPHVPPQPSLAPHVPSAHLSGVQQTPPVQTSPALAQLHDVVPPQPFDTVPQVGLPWSFLQTVDGVQPQTPGVPGLPPPHLSGDVQQATGWPGSHVPSARLVQQTGPAFGCWHATNKPPPWAASLVHLPAAGVSAPNTCAQKWAAALLPPPARC